MNAVNRLRGNRRKQLIDRWLRGEEDENYEVVPTRTEGRFIVKQRKTPLKTTEQETPSVLTPEESSDGSEESQDTIEEEPKQKQKKQLNETSVSSLTSTSAANTTNGSTPTSTSEQRSPVVASSLTTNGSTSTADSISLQILEQLRLLGEENRRRNERKERRRETKAMVQKQLLKQSFRHSGRMRSESDYSDEYSYDASSDYSCDRREYEHSPGSSLTTEGSSEKQSAAPVYVRRRLNLLHRQG